MFSVRVDRLVEDLVVVVVVGEIDSLTAPKLSTTLHCELERQPGVLVLDLTGVSFLGVAGLQVLDCALARAKTIPAVLNLVHHDQSVVQSALRAGVMTELFPTFRTVAQACARSAPVTMAPVVSAAVETKELEPSIPPSKGRTITQRELESPSMHSQ